MQDSSSNEQQQHSCRRKAEENQHQIAAQFEFADEAVSGTKKERHGLNAMLEAARAGRFSVLYVYSLSRLARELAIILPLIKELIYVHKIRVISVIEGVDSNQPGWETPAVFQSLMHQEFIKTLRAHVMGGLDGAIRADRSVGDWPFGYGSVPITGSESARRGRNKKPEMQYVINQDHAAWVLRIFYWFVVEKRTIRWIVKKLNRMNAPKDRRSQTPDWHHTYITKLLRNQKYIGIWKWGQTTREVNPLTGQVRQEKRDPVEAAKWDRDRPDLRIVEDDMFFKAQSLLDEHEAKFEQHRRPNGQLHGAPKGGNGHRTLLQGILKCTSCGENFRRIGTNVVYVGCSKAFRGTCDVKARAPRALAEQQILEVVSERIMGDPEFRQKILEEAERAWTEYQNTGPEEEARLKKEIETLKTKIGRLVDSIEEGTADASVKDRLTTRRRELAERERAFKERAGVNSSVKNAPTAAWVDEQCRNLCALLRNTTPAANEALRKLIGDVTVREVQLPGRKRKGLIATVSVSLRAAAGVVGVDNAENIDCGDSDSRVDVILNPLPPWAKHADRVKELFDAERRDDQIAKELAIHYNWVPKARRWWYGIRGLEVPSAVRPYLCRKPVKKAERLSEPAKALWDQGLEMGQIGERLGVNRSMARDAVQFWFRSHGLTYVDGRSRSCRATRIKAAENHLPGSSQGSIKAHADPGTKSEDSPSSSST